MTNSMDSNPQLANSIFWGNTAPSGPEIFNDTLSPSITHSDIQGAFAGGSWDSSLGSDDGGNLDTDPLFVDTPNGDLRYQDGSPVLNAGDNSRLPADISDLDGDKNTTERIPLDLDGGLRIVNSVVDLGVYENNIPPTVSDISAQFTDEDTPTSLILFTVGDLDGSTNSLTLTANSSNTSLIPQANITFGGSGANRTVLLTPAADQFGIATITIIIPDGELTASDNFQLTVNPINDAPVLAAIGDQSGFVGQQHLAREPLSRCLNTKKTNPAG